MHNVFQSQVSLKSKEKLSHVILNVKLVRTIRQVVHHVTKLVYRFNSLMIINVNVSMVTLQIEEILNL